MGAYRQLSSRAVEQLHALIVLKKGELALPQVFLKAGAHQAL